MSAVVKQFREDVEDTDVEDLAIADSLRSTTFPSPMDRTNETANRAMQMRETSADTLANWIGNLKRMESDLESAKAQASKDCAAKVEAAEAERASVHKTADAALIEIRASMKALEPARAGLAERA